MTPAHDFDAIKHIRILLSATTPDCVALPVFKGLLIPDTIKAEIESESKSLRTSSTVFEILKTMSRYFLALFFSLAIGSGDSVAQEDQPSSATVQETPESIDGKLTPHPLVSATKNLALFKEVDSAPCQPKYPDQMRHLGLEGRVGLRIHIDQEGIPLSVEVKSSSGYKEFDRSAVDAAYHCVYPKKKVNGVPVEWVVRDYEFKLRPQKTSAD